MAVIEGLEVRELQRYRGGARSKIPGLDVTEYGARPQAPAPMQMDVSGNSPYAQGQRGARPAAVAPPVQPVVAAAPPRLGAIANAARVLPAVAGTAAFNLAGNSLADNTQGAPAVATSAPGAIPNDPSLNFPAPPATQGNFFNQSDIGRNVGNIVNAVGAGRTAATALRGAGALAVRNPALASPVARGADIAAQGIAAGNAANVGLPVIPGGAAPAAAAPVGGPADPNIGPPFDPNIQVNQVTDPAAVAAAPKAATAAAAPNGRSVMDIERAALDIERQNSGIRKQMDAYGPGPRNADGSGGAVVMGADEIKRYNEDAKASNRRFDARLAGAGGGRHATARAGAINASVDALERLQAGEREAEGRLGVEAARTAGAGAVNAANIETTRRGQDIAATTAANAGRNAMGIAETQGRTQRDVAGLGADSRLAAAEARAVPKLQVINMPDTLGPDGITPIKGGQVLYNSATGEIVRPGDAGAAGGAGAPKVTPKAEYDKMPKGARYVGPDGKTYVKG